MNDIIFHRLVNNEVEEVCVNMEVEDEYVVVKELWMKIRNKRRIRINDNEVKE